MFMRRDRDVLLGKLDPFRGCFSKPQWFHFRTYLGGLIYGEKGEKNISDIADNMIYGRDQSSLNRFITQSRWDARRIDNTRQSEFIGNKKGGTLILDDTIIEKWGKSMEGVLVPLSMHGEFVNKRKLLSSVSLKSLSSPSGSTKSGSISILPLPQSKLGSPSR